MQSFLGFCNFYRKFILNYGRIARPLTALTRKENPFTWTTDCQQVFAELKACLIAAPLLVHFNPDYESMVETDASDGVDKQERNTYDLLLQPESTSLSEIVLNGLDEVDEQLLEGNHERPPQRRQIWRQWNMYIVMVLVASITAASGIAGFIVGTFTARTAIKTTTPSLQTTASHHDDSGHMHDAPKAIQIKDCGETPHDAKARGCVFDLMLQRWTPAECFDEEHMERFLAKYPRKWYFDIDLERKMDDETSKDYLAQLENQVQSGQNPN